jgi:hypothetical protein
VFAHGADSREAARIRGVRGMVQKWVIPGGLSFVSFCYFELIWVHVHNKKRKKRKTDAMMNWKKISSFFECRTRITGRLVKGKNQFSNY